MTVFAYIDNQPKPINQGEIVQYFQSRPTGGLVFTQSTLSCKLKNRKILEE
jgi:pyridoxine/pyridoxamine 5'-phosphate oxidase